VKTKSAVTAGTIKLPPTPVHVAQIDLRLATILIEGTSPLVVHAWGEKAKKMMRDKQAKKAKVGREVRDPEQEFRDSLYYVNREKQPIYGFPAVGFKAAAGTAWSHMDGMKKGIILGSFHIINGVPTPQGDLVPITYADLRMREDMVRVGMGSADLRYRGEFSGWKTRLQVKYNASSISIDQLVSVLDVAGFAIGVGEWRPAKEGSYGMFQVVGVE